MIRDPRTVRLTWGVFAVLCLRLLMLVGWMMDAGMCLMVTAICSGAVAAVVKLDTCVSRLNNRVY